MRAEDRFLAQVWTRTGGRSDCTVHASLHVAKPLGLSPEEARACISALLTAGLIGADPMFDRLVWLTPLGAAAVRRCDTDVVMRETPSAAAPLDALVARSGMISRPTAHPLHD